MKHDLTLKACLLSVRRCIYTCIKVIILHLNIYTCSFLFDQTKPSLLYGYMEAISASLQNPNLILKISHSSGPLSATIVEIPKPASISVEEVPAKSPTKRSSVSDNRGDETDFVRPDLGGLGRGRRLTSLGPLPGRTSKNFALYLKHRP